MTLPNPSAQTLEAPELFQFLDYRKYLLAYYQFRKQENPQFSYRSFARLAGMSSLNYLKMIVSGQRNLNRAYARNLVKVCGLSAAEGKYFLALVEWNQSRSDTERLSNWQAVVELAPKKEDFYQLSNSQLQVLSSWQAIVIMEMFRLKDFVFDPKWVSQRLRGGISEEEVAQIFRQLEKAGLIAKDGDGQHQVVSQEILKLSGEMKNTIVEIFHRHMSREAIQAVQEIPPESREFVSLTLPIRRSELPRFQQEIRKFSQQILKMAGRLEGSDEVYQLTLQFFPLTETRAKKTET